MYVKIQVIPESRDERVTEEAGRLVVAVREKAQQGAANRRVLQLLSAHFGAGGRGASEL